MDIIYIKGDVMYHVIAIEAKAECSEARGP